MSCTDLRCYVVLHRRNYLQNPQYLIVWYIYRDGA